MLENGFGASSIDEESDDGGFDPQPPPAGRVARRSLVLCALACRGFVERDREQRGTAEFWSEARAWFASLGVDDELEGHERKVLDARLGSLQAQAAIDLGWLSEGMVVLGWALARVELPGITQACDPGCVATSLGFRERPERTVLAAPSLRPHEDLQRTAATLLTAHWRLREFSRRPKALDFAAYVARCEWADLRLDELELVDGDLALDGTPLTACDARTRSHVTSIVRERHRAANWLLGDAPSWSDVTTDT